MERQCLDLLSIIRLVSLQRQALQIQLFQLGEIFSLGRRTVLTLDDDFPGVFEAAVTDYQFSQRGEI